MNRKLYLITLVVALVLLVSASIAAAQAAGPQPSAVAGTDLFLPSSRAGGNIGPASPQQTGQITGIVTAAGAPVGGFWVRAYTNCAGSTVGSGGYVDGAGRYTIGGLDTGAYMVKFAPYSTYAPQWYNNKSDCASADPVPVTDGAATQNITASLQTLGRITGQVTATVGGAPLQSVSVRVYTSTTSSEWGYMKSASTGASGYYTITDLAAGNYYLMFDPPGSNYLAEFYDNEPSLATADAVAVTLDSTTTVNAALDTYGRITGQVTATVGGAPLQNVSVKAYTSTTASEGGYVESDSTDASGFYTITGLAAGNYYLMFDPPGSNYLAEFYDNKPSLATADAISVTLDSTTTINASLDSLGQIKGQVTAATGGAPLQNVSVKAYTSTTAAEWDDVASDSTDASGYYTLTSLAVSDYYLKFEPPSGSDYIGEYYNDKTSLATADAIPVALNSVVTDVNAALTLGSKITGQVTASDTHLPLEDVQVTLYAPGPCDARVSKSHYTTGASGFYTFTGLVAGTYWVEFSPLSYGASAAYLDEYYHNKLSLDKADDIVLTDATKIVNEELDRGAQIKGQVTGQGGAGLSEVYVTAHGPSYGFATTDATGAYTITALMSGTYRVEFAPSSSGASKDYAYQYYDTKSIWSTANTVSVTAPNIVSVNQALPLGSRIMGRVTATDTALALQNSSVNVYDSEGRNVGNGTANASGYYTTTALPTGNYRVEFEPGYTHQYTYTWQYYNNKLTLTAADVISVTAPDPANNINAALARGGQISGTIKAGDTNLPLAGMGVAVYDSNGSYVLYTSSDAAGNYLTEALPPGNYRVRFSGQSGCLVKCYLGQYYSNKPDLASATVVPVTASNVTQNINATLTACSVTPPASVTISGPAEGAMWSSITFNAAVSPVDASQPITYTWQATGLTSVIHTGRGISDTVNFAWTVTGTKTVTVTAANAGGAVTNHRTITVNPSTIVFDHWVYLPAVLKP